jgi:hypothetical protein
VLNYKPLINLPEDIQRDWRAELHQADPTEEGVFRLVGIRRTRPQTFQEGRLIVLVVDENGFPLPGVTVAFAYDTADQYTVSDDFLWSPPHPRQANIVYTEGSGQIEQIQGDVVKQGEPGGMTVYILESRYASDYVTGLGMLANHTGLYLIFQLCRTGVESFMDRLEKRLKDLEDRIASLEGL